MYLHAKCGTKNLNFVTRCNQFGQTLFRHSLYAEKSLSFFSLINPLFLAERLSAVTVIDLAGWFLQSAVLTHRHHAANRP